MHIERVETLRPMPTHARYRHGLAAAGEDDIKDIGRKSFEPVGACSRAAADRRQSRGAEKSCPLLLLSRSFAAMKNNREPDELPSASKHHAGHGVSIKAGACELGPTRDVALAGCNCG
jgi:hypothetical protein